MTTAIEHLGIDPGNSDLTRGELEAALGIARVHLSELGKMADRAALVLTTIEGEDTPEDDAIQEIIDAVRAIASIIPAGEPGECDRCGEWSGRLVGGACAPCRDRYGLS